MTGKINLTKEVFGIQRDLPLNYVNRDADKILVDSLDRKHHVVIYGSSKQGKTSLRKKNLSEDQYIIIHCSNKWDLSQIHINILKQAGYEITVSDKKTTTGKAKVKVTVGWNLFAKAEGETEGEYEKGKETEKAPLELDPEDVNDVIKALIGLKLDKYIILEDFHYLKQETQNDFAIALKAFHENSSFTFIIVGVWLEENRLIAINGDLSGRVKSVNADNWSTEELFQLISDGEMLLNIEFDEVAKVKLIQESLQNVYIVQEVCYELCKINSIEQTVEGETTVLDCKDIEKLIQHVIYQHAGRYNKFITSFIDGFQATDLEMHKWILYSLLTSPLEKLEVGLRRNEISKVLNDKHPKGENLNPGNLTQALNSVASLQIKKGITPIIIDYDSSNLRINIVDKGFTIWLNNQDRAEVLEAANLPID